MSLSINGFVFDAHEGSVIIPTWSTRVFVRPGTPHVGVHLQPPTGDVFSLTCTRFDTEANLRTVIDTQLDRIGRTNPIIAMGTDYSLPPYTLTFYAVSVEIISEEILAYAAGHRSGANVEYDPACKVVSRWQLVAVPQT